MTGITVIPLPEPNEQFTFDQLQNWQELGGIKLAIPDFRGLAESGIYNKDNGTGYYANDEKVSTVKVNFDDLFLPDPTPGEDGKYQMPITVRHRMAGGTHVVWFPKPEEEEEEE